MKKKNSFLIISFSLILICVLIFFLFFYHPSPKLNQEEILTSGTDDSGEVTSISINNFDQLSEIIKNSVENHLD